VNIFKHDLALLFAKDTKTPLDAIANLHCYVELSVLTTSTALHL